MLVKPATVIQWHRQGFRLFWRWRNLTPSRPFEPDSVWSGFGGIARKNGELNAFRELRRSRPHVSCIGDCTTVIPPSAEAEPRSSEDIPMIALKATLTSWN